MLEARRRAKYQTLGLQGPQGVPACPDTSAASISHPGEALQATSRGKLQGGFFPRPTGVRWMRARPLVGVLGLASQTPYLEVRRRLPCTLLLLSP